MEYAIEYTTVIIIQGEAIWLQNLTYALTYADPDIFLILRELIIVGCTSLIGSCEAERSFSVIRPLESHLRSTMGEERLASLALMTMHYDSCRQLETETIIQRFVKAHPRKLFCNSILFN